MVSRCDPSPDSPICSVIVPVHNGERFVVNNLNALADQTVSPDRYEIIVVDDGSTDNTAQLVAEWAGSHPRNKLTLVRRDIGGLASARNHGAQMASSSLLLFVDCDCVPVHHWIEALMAPFADPEIVGAKGTYRTVQTGLVPSFVQAEYEDRYDRMQGSDRINFIDAYSAAYRRDIFRQNNGFDTTFTVNEDQEFSFRLAQKGYRLVFVPQAQVTHDHDADLRDYWRRKYRIGYWKSLLTRLHPERMVHDSHTPQVLKIQIVLLALILSLLPFALVGIVEPGLMWLWAPMLGAGAAFFATALPFLGKLVRHSWRLALFGSVVLVVRAMALGSGYLVGTVHFADVPTGRRQPVIPGWKRFIKRCMDIAGALVGLVISIPLVAVAAIAIKLDSPGPVFFWQVRIGENGHPFGIVKLRSMVTDAEERLPELIDLNTLPEPVYKIVDDPRVTRVGRILRRTSLDETPQFYNVLIGDMSLVGPRPEEAQIVAMYQDYQRRRLAVKPGLTGPMQVNGRGGLSLNERLRLELDYIDNYSLWGDIAIILRTIPALLRGQGAY